MQPSRLHWKRGRTAEQAGGPCTVEWVGCDEGGKPVARVVRIMGPLYAGWRRYLAVALDREARIIELRPPAPEGAEWLAYVGNRVVGRAAWPLQAVRRVEAALAMT